MVPHQPCDSRIDTGAVYTPGWEHRGSKSAKAKQGQPMSQPMSHEGSALSGVPYTEVAPGGINISSFRSALLAAFLFCFAVLGSLHGEFIVCACPYVGGLATWLDLTWDVSTLSQYIRPPG